MRSTSTPLQNRVLPTGEIVSDPGRGLFMGNRGCLHGPDRKLGSARWRSKAWICCTLDWKDVRRDPMPPGRWTALFFLDEATALAAGHRPCAYCRRKDFIAFAEAWRLAHGLRERPRAPEMDDRLHAQRIEPGLRRQQTLSTTMGELPEATIVRYQGILGLVIDESVRPWSFGGYGPPVPVSRDTRVDQLTPPATVAAIAAGYRPSLHPSSAP